MTEPAFDVIAGSNFRPGRRAELERGRPYVFQTLVAGAGDASPSPSRLTLVSLRGQGRSYDVYNAILGQRPVVAKICDPWLAAGDRQLEAGDEVVHTDRQSIMTREAQVYTALKGLQGTTIPTFFGLWRGTCPSKSEYRPDFELLVMVVEDVGESLQSKVRDWEQAGEFKKSIRSAYDELHAAGVVHNDLNLCNILVSGSRLSLVDFESALRSGDAGFDEALKSEQAQLLQVL